jgi:hypothetical protein
MSFSPYFPTRFLEEVFMACCIYLLNFSHRVFGGDDSNDDRWQEHARIRGSVRIYLIV